MAPISKKKITKPGKASKPARVTRSGNAGKSGKATVTDAISFGNFNILKDDVKTIAALLRFGKSQVEAKGEADHMSQVLGITKNAWTKRWKRVKAKLDQVPIVTVAAPEASASAHEDNTPATDDKVPENEEDVANMADDDSTLEV